MVKNTDEVNDIVIINRHIKNLSIIFISFLIRQSTNRYNNSNDWNTNRPVKY